VLNEKEETGCLKDMSLSFLLKTTKIQKVIDDVFL
jgi:hypothetical protein